MMNNVVSRCFAGAKGSATFLLHCSYAELPCQAAPAKHRFFVVCSILRRGCRLCGWHLDCDRLDAQHRNLSRAHGGTMHSATEMSDQRKS